MVESRHGCLGDDQHVHGCSRRHVVNGDAELILVHKLRWYFFADDAAEDAVQALRASCGVLGLMLLWCVIGDENKSNQRSR